MQTVPSWFVKLYRDKFGGNMMLSYVGDSADWKVKVNVYKMNQYGHISFANGFQDFCQMYNLEDGDHLKFPLIRKSHFYVNHVDGASTSAAEIKEVDNNWIE